MNLAWKEIKKNKARFLILGSIIFLVSFLTFMISGLSNGLSQDNASLIKDLPDGHFYMNADAEENYLASKIDKKMEEKILAENKNAAALAIQMGFINDDQDRQHSVAFVTAAQSPFFDEVKKGEVILDRSLKAEGVKIGDKVKNNQYEGELIVKGFADHKKFSHAPAAFINQEDYQEIFKQNEMQFIFLQMNDEIQSLSGLQSFTNDEFLSTIPSYSAEQLSLTMISWFLIVISGMLFTIFFYMMNVQKIGLYGILKAIGMKTKSLFVMMWSQMIIITLISLSISVLLSQALESVAPQGLPFYLPAETSLQLSLVFAAVGFIGATLSGIQIKKVEPLKAIQQGEG
ncbi:FtsX-like permease family protein [Peribacillus frigoritolerans]|uniref:FtsX-like permease family protein n=1 Tax=Peribacillus frigoritolerans TaxID=450367 RepID=UPI00105AA78D|nr:FtsX-like permease family protein [Peribacillus frigoritolerans]TDL82809.1 ABC transporter permease [Peribacillus frigoritolerans]